MLRPDAACLRDFRKILSMSQDRALVWKSHWEELGWAQKLGGAGLQGITEWGKQCEPGCWSLRYGACLPTVRGGLIKGTMASASASVWQKAASHTTPPPLGVMLENSVPPGMSLVPFKLLLPRWSSEGVSLRNFMYVPFRRNYLGLLQKPPSPSASVLISVGFYSQKLWGLTFLAPKPWPRGDCAGLGPHSSGGPPQPRYPSHFLSTTYRYGTSLFSLPLLPVSMWLLCISSCRTSIQLCFRWF